MFHIVGLIIYLYILYIYIFDIFSKNISIHIYIPYKCSSSRICPTVVHVGNLLYTLWLFTYKQNAVSLAQPEIVRWSVLRFVYRFLHMLLCSMCTQGKYVHAYTHTHTQFPSAYNLWSDSMAAVGQCERSIPVGGATDAIAGKCFISFQPMGARIPDMCVCTYICMYANCRKLSDLCANAC